MIRKRKNAAGQWRYDPQTWDPKRGKRVGAKELLGEPGTYSTLTEAKRTLRRMQDAIDEGAQPDTGPTVSQWVQRWLAEYPRPKDSTNQTNRYALKRLIEGEHKDVPLTAFTRDMARAVGIENPATARVAQACWNDAMYEAEIQGLEKNPWVRLKLPPAGRRKLALTEPEVFELANLAPRVFGGRYGPVVRGLVIFAAYSGLRLGELCAMRWDWIDGDTLWVARSLSRQGVETSCKHRSEEDPPQPVAIVQPAQEALRSIPRSLTGYVWTLPSGGRMSHAAFHHHWAQLRATFLMQERDSRRQQQLDELVFHSLRHTAATLLAERGFDRWSAMAQLRHRDPSMVDGVYTHIDETAARKRMVEQFRSSETGTSTVTKGAESQ